MSKFLFRLIFFAILLGIDVYVYHSLSMIFKRQIWIKLVYLLSSLLVLGTIVYMIGGFHILRGGRAPWQNLIFGLVFTLVVTKLLYAGMLLMADVLTVIEWLGRKIARLPIEKSSYWPGRRNFINNTVALIASIPFTAMLYGMTRGKYAYGVERVTIPISGLPKAFDGFKILQVSDIHAGSFDSIARVQSGIDICNDQGADMVVFTGDLVNSDKDEIDPYADVFRQLRAPYGKYAVMGNHDYYGWYRMSDAVQRRQYEKEMHGKFGDVGFDLLLDEHRIIEKDGQYITLAGVENWGAGPFMKKGDLNKALQEADADSTVILMSHDPSHWDHEIIPYHRKVDLTLSGHTHGFQFGINLPGMKWSPAQWRYPHWLGLYEQDEQYLYVNRGFGFLGFPGRVGMLPEITVLELKAV